jgi:hypothetical protein
MPSGGNVADAAVAVPVIVGRALDWAARRCATANISPMVKPVIRRGLESPRNETGVFSTWKRSLWAITLPPWGYYTLLTR